MPYAPCARPSPSRTRSASSRARKRPCWARSACGSPSDYVAWLRALFELSLDAIIESIYEIAREKHGIVAVGHTIGTLSEGGSFESVFVQVLHFEGERPTGAELFELEDLDVARARFEALRSEAAA